MRTVVAGGETAELRVSAAADFIAGARVAELEVEPGELSLVVSLRDAGGEVMSRPVRVSVRGRTVVTVVFTRDCRGVVCPGAGDTPEATACFGGRCVDPRCTPERPELCGDAECDSDGMCVAPTECAVGVCLDGACGAQLRDDRCGPGEVCDLDGCSTAPPDAGPRDAGPVGADSGPLVDAGPSCVPAIETCNGSDDDCDGSIDETIDPPPCALMEGVCAGAVQRCGGPAGWLACDAGTYGSDYEATETRCERLDNDCDGMIDEGCACTDGTTQPCGPTGGECRQGMQSCTGGAWGPCTGGVEPTTEACNARDDDCDGSIDETFALGAACDGGDLDRCDEGTIVCRLDGSGTACNDATGDRVETCDGADEDCDGAVDEGAGTSLHRDADGDTWGVAAITVTCPGAGYVARGGDCDDLDRNVNPGVTAFSASARTGGSYDWNCDGREELGPVPTPLENCRSSTTMCVDDSPCGSTGWSYSGDCGEVAREVDCVCDSGESSCDGRVLRTRTLTCR